MLGADWLQDVTFCLCHTYVPTPPHPVITASTALEILNHHILNVWCPPPPPRIRYASCSRAISGVPVCYYADRVAGRVRDYCYEYHSSDTASQVSESSSSSSQPQPMDLTPTLHDNVLNSMFFA